MGESLQTLCLVGDAARGPLLLKTEILVICTVIALSNNLHAPLRAQDLERYLVAGGLMAGGAAHDTAHRVDRPHSRDLAHALIPVPFSEAPLGAYTARCQICCFNQVMSPYRQHRMFQKVEVQELSAQSNFPNAHIPDYWIGKLDLNLRDVQLVSLGSF